MAEGDVDYNVSLDSDSSSLEKSIKQVISVMESLESSINNTSKMMENAFNNLSKAADNTGKKASKSMNDVDKAMRSAESSIQPSIVKLMDLTNQYERTAQAAKNVGDSSGMRKAADAMEYYKQRVEGGFESTAQLSAETTRLTRALSDVEKESQRYDRTMIAMEKSIGSAEREIAMLTARMKAMGASEEEITPLSEALKQYQEDLKAAGGSQREIVQAQERYKTSLAEVKNAMEEKGRSVRSATGDNSAFTQQLQHSTKAVQLALGPLSGIASRITAFTSLVKTGSVSVAAFTASIVGLLVATNRIINVGIEYERQMLAMDSSIQATGRSAETTVGQMDALAVSIAAATLTSSTKARQALNVLMSFSNISVDLFEDITLAAQGMASTFGGDVVSSTRLLARAVEQPASSLDSLRRVGIQFTDSQKDLIKSFERTGQVARAQNVIMERVAVFNESAQSQAKGLAGQLDAVGDNMQTLMEKISSQIQTNEQLSEAYGVVNQMLTDLIENSDVLANVFDSIGAVVGVSAKALRFLGENYEFVAAAMSMVVAGAAIKMVPLLLSLVGINGRNAVAALQHTKALYAQATAARAGTLSFKTMAVAARGLLVALGPLALAFTAGATVLTLLNGRTNSTSDAMRAYQEVLGRTEGSTDAFTESQANAASAVRRVTDEMVNQANARLLELNDQYYKLEQSLEGLGETMSQAISDAMPTTAEVGRAFRTISNEAGSALSQTQSDLQNFGRSLDDALERVRNGANLAEEEVISLGQEAQRLGLETEFTRVLQQFPALRDQITATKDGVEELADTMGEIVSDPQALLKGLTDTFGDVIYDFDKLESRINEFEFTSIVNNTDAAVTAIQNKFGELISRTEAFADTLGLSEDEIDSFRKMMNAAMDEAIAGVNNLEDALKEARTEGVRDFAQEVSRSFQLINASSEAAKKSLENAFSIEDGVNSAIDSMLDGETSMERVVEAAEVLEQQLHGTAAAFLINVDAIRESENPLETYRAQLTAIAEASQVFTRSTGSSSKSAKAQESAINSLVKKFNDYNNTLIQYQALQDGGNSARLNAIAMQEEAEAIKSIDDALEELSAGQLQKFAQETGVVVQAGETVREAMIRMYRESTAASKQLDTQVNAIESLEESLKELAAESDNASRRMQALTKGGVAGLDKAVRRLEVEDRVKGIVDAFKALNVAAKQDFVDQFNRAMPGLNANLDNFEERLYASSDAISEVEVASEKARETLDEFDGVIEGLTDRQKDVDAIMKSLSTPFMNNSNAREMQNAIDAFNSMGSGEQAAQLEKMRTLFPHLTWEANNFGDALQRAFQETQAQEDWANSINDAVTDAGDSIRNNLVGAIEGSVTSFSNAADEIKNIFNNLLADLLYQAAVKPIVMNVQANMSGLMQGMSGIGGQQGGMQGMNISPGMLQSGWNTVSGWWGGGASSGAGGLYANAATQSAGTLYGSAATGAAQGGLYGNAATGGVAQGGASVGANAMGGLYTAGAGIAGGYAGTEIGGAVSGKTANSNVGATAGAVAGAYIGSIVPVIGTYLGSAIGGFVGGLGDSLFGSKKRGPRVNVSTYADSSGFDTDSIAQGAFGVVGFSEGSRRIDEMFGGKEGELEWLESVAAMDNMLASVAESPTQLDDMGYAVRQVVLSANDAATVSQMLALRTEAAASIIDEDLTKSLVSAGLNAEQMTVRVVDAVNTMNLLRDSSERLNLQFDSTAEGVLSATDNLSQLVGGFQNLEALQTSYFQNYFSEAERAAFLQEDLTAEFARYGATLPKTRDEFRKLVEAQDLNTEAGQRNYVALLDVSSAFDQLQKTTEDAFPYLISAAQKLNLQFDSTVDGAEDMSNAIRDYLGGMEALTEIHDNYYDTVFSNTEKAINLQKDVAGSLAEITDSAPESIESLRALVEAQDINTESGAKLAYELMQIAPAMKEAENAIKKVIDEQANYGLSILQESVDAEKRILQEQHDSRIALLQSQSAELMAVSDSIRNNAQSAFNKLQTSVNAEINALQDSFESARSGIQSRIQKLSENSGDIERLIGSLSSEIRKISSTNPERNVITFERSQSALDQQTLSGSLDSDIIGKAIEGLSNNNTSMYSTRTAYNKSQLIAENSLVALRDSADKQLSTDERTVAALERQLEILSSNHNSEVERLNLVLENAKMQLDRLLGIDNSVLDVETSLSKFNASASEENILMLEANIRQQSLIEREIATLEANHSAEVSRLDAIVSNAQTQIDKLTGIDNGVFSLSKAMYTFDETLRSIKNLLGQQQQQSSLMGFATGGVVSGPKSGYPVEMHGTEAIIPLGNGSLPLEIKGLPSIDNYSTKFSPSSSKSEMEDIREELVAMKEQGKDLNDMTYKMLVYIMKIFKIEDKWDNLGIPTGED